MSLPGGLTGFSDCKRFWGIQLDKHYDDKQVRVNSDTKLHISNAIVDFGTFSHQDKCSVTIGVRYEPDPCDCEKFGESCRHQKHGQCVLCIIKPEKKGEADLDLNFVGQKNLNFYYSCNCVCDYKCHNFSVNISGYEVRAG